MCREACKKDLGCDYYFSIDSDVALINADALRILIEENKYVFIPGGGVVVDVLLLTCVVIDVCVSITSTYHHVFIPGCVCVVIDVCCY